MENYLKSLDTRQYAAVRSICFCCFVLAISVIVAIWSLYFYLTGPYGDGILTGGIHCKTDACHLFQQSICVMLQFIFQFIPIERDHLIKADLLAARQNADLAAFLHALETGQNSGAELRVLRKG